MFSISEINALLRCLGIRLDHIGFYHLSCALALAVQQPERLLRVTQQIYPAVAEQYHTSWYCVERNIRAAVQRAWKNNRPLLEQVMGCPLPQRPTSSAFLAAATALLTAPPASPKYFQL